MKYSLVLNLKVYGQVDAVDYAAAEKVADRLSKEAVKKTSEILLAEVTAGRSFISAMREKSE